MKELTTGKMFNISDWRCKRRWDHDILIHHCRNQSNENITSNSFKIFPYCNYFINCFGKKKSFWRVRGHEKTTKR